ncbi:MAG: anaerobic ribonucleoside-triphosphate reductase activating protein [Thermoplasmata archaeon]|nr:anaerobic ribonucleoside-triphosphate reductase activating protein [Thermoplasmata archaeon]
MKIKGFLKTSFLDWDGKVSSVVFLPGCNFRCGFCHNWLLVNESDKIPDVPEDYVLSFLRENVDFVDGVCITGGEPCLHPSDVLEFARKVRELGLGVKVDTNGSMPDVLRRLLEEGAVDYVAMDVKAPLEAEKYGAVCGVSVDLEKIKESIHIVKEIGNYEFRTTYIPELHTEEDVQAILVSLSMPKKYVLQRFVAHNAFSEKLRKGREVCVEELEAIARRMAGLAEKIVVR